MKIEVFSMYTPKMELKELRVAFIKKFNRYQPIKPSNTEDTEAMKVYHQQKANVQKLWLKYMEEDLYDSISMLLAEAKIAERHDELFLIVLPETYFSDIQWDKEDAYGYTYLNPFYEETILDFIMGRISREKSLRSLSRENVMIVGGTIWWKEVHNSEDVLFNSVPTFYQGRLIHIWDKQLLAQNDIVDNDEKTLKKWTKYRGELLGIKNQSDRGSFARETMDQLETYKKDAIILSDLSKMHNFNKTNTIKTQFNGEQISFAVEICIEHISGIFDWNELEVPNIRICVAKDLGFSSMTYAEEYKHMKDYLLICDGYNKHVLVVVNIAKQDEGDTLKGTMVFTCNNIVRRYKNHGFVIQNAP